MKTCRQCYKDLPYEKFWRESKAKDGFRASCICCLNKRRHTVQSNKIKEGQAEFPDVEELLPHISAGEISISFHVPQKVYSARMTGISKSGQGETMIEAVNALKKLVSPLPAK